MSSSTKGATYIQKLFPTVNNEDLLEFRIPPNIKGNMLLSDVWSKFRKQVTRLKSSPKISLEPNNLEV